MIPMKTLAGRVAIVTGGGSGIGRGAALALGKRGVAVTVADVDAARAAAVAEEIVAGGGKAAGIACDVSDDSCFELLRDETLSRFGHVHIVMNNAAQVSLGLPEDMPLSEWQRIIDINLLSIVRSNLAFLPLLIAQGEGHIVNTASFSGLMTYSFDRLPYAATKAATVQISEGLAIYLKPKGIGVTMLCPGPVRTNIMNSVRSFGSIAEQRTPGPEFALKEPEAVGEQVVEAITSGRFMLPTDEQVIDHLKARAGDWDGFINRQIDQPHILARPPSPK